MHTAEALKPEPHSLEVEITTEKLERYKSPGTDQLPAKVIQAGGNILCSENHKLIHSISNNEELPQQWTVSITVHT
jgi:hypothetical protein